MYSTIEIAAIKPDSIISYLTTNPLIPSSSMSTCTPRVSESLTTLMCLSSAVGSGGISSSPDLTSSKRVVTTVEEWPPISRSFVTETELVAGSSSSSAGGGLE